MITRVMRAIAAAVLAAAWAGWAPASADLIITPQRIVFEGDERSHTLSVVNTAAERRTYELVWSHMRMNEEGRILLVDSEAGGVSSFVVFSPRRITLDPGQTQNIRLALRRPPNLPSGEYRSHLELQVVEVPDSIPETRGGEGLGAQLNIRLGFRLPVIVRHGGGSTEVGLAAERLDADAGQLEVRIDRAGPFSVYGDLHAFWRPDETAELEAIGRLSGVAVYPEVNQRRVAIPLLPGALPDLSTGEVFVYFVDPANANDVLAETGARL